MNCNRNLVFVSSTLVLLGWASGALGQGLSTKSPTSSTVQGHYYGAFVPIVTIVGNTTFTKINFEGIGDLNVIGEIIPGVTFDANCQALVDADAGGSGNFANEPSESTIAFFLSGGGCTVTFAEPISGVSFLYSSSVNVTLNAFNSTNEPVATAVGEATPLGTVGGDPDGDFDKWVSLGVNVATNSISTVQILGVNNQTGFDDFTFARVDFTEPNEAIAMRIVSQAGQCRVERILGDRGRTAAIETEEGSGCFATGEEDLQITVNGVTVSGVFVSPNAEIAVEGTHKYCWASTTTGKMTCVLLPH